jgi:hypothetical protein
MFSLVLGAMLALTQAPTARASPPTYPFHSGVVSICTEASLLAALAGGGAVTFSPGDCLITVSATILITAPTTIDGAGQRVTLSGGDTLRSSRPRWA